MFVKENPDRNKTVSNIKRIEAPLHLFIFIYYYFYQIIKHFENEEELSPCPIFGKLYIKVVSRVRVAYLKE